MPEVRFKVVPPVRAVGFLREAAETLPLVPGSVEDCCTRVRDGTAVTSRDEAREYLTFMQALGLVAETDRGFHRVRDAPSDEELPTAFRERVFGAREVLECVATEPRTPEAVFTAIREEIPRWERNRHEDWEAEWHERIERLLGWAAVFDLVTESDGQYRAAQ
ncbi:hypothetical protein GOC74_09115 [Halomicrobium mukohataei]|uniref:Uncharacterized protein n=1 Tax=Halomicrobium mukohataei TaxID=57705 RepID=A0A847UG77_9EURY|nr:hypothetical protein [Halomicrobium mukohataei]NLV10088.1 hypothetical protein [Halomicrobium mukohataei]